MLENGKTVKEVKLEKLNIGPLEKKIIQLPVSSDELKKGKEYIARVEFYLKDDEKWAKKGTRVAYEQFILQEYDYVPEHLLQANTNVKIEESDTLLVVSGNKFSVTFNKTNGALLSYIMNGNEFIHFPLEPYFWKPPNNNQERNGYVNRLSVWKKAALNRKLKNMEINTDEGRVQLVFNFILPVKKSKLALTYEINGNATVKVNMNYTPDSSNIPLIPKFGMRMAIPKGYNNIEWYGRGPHENYWDRKTSALIGIYKMNLEDFITPYISTQDNANRADTRWIVFSDKEGKGLKFEGQQPLSFRAWPYMEDDLENTKHNYELPRRDFINVNIDYKVHGVGGTDSWGERTLPCYTIDGNKELNYGFILSVIE